jgi:hypothetical protein
MGVVGELSLIAGATLLILSVTIGIWNLVRRWRGKGQVDPSPEA